MNALDTLFTSVVNAGQTAAKAASQTADAVVNAAATYVNERAEDIADVGEAAASGNLVKAGLEFVEFVSVGEVAKDAATAVGLLPQDGGLMAEVVSAIGNAAAGSPIALVKDLSDIAAELGKAPRNDKVAPSKGQTTPKKNAGGAAHYPEPGLIDRSAKDALKDFGVCSGHVADTLKDLVNRGVLLPPSVSGHPPVACPAPSDITVDIPSKVRDDFANNPQRTGGPVLGRPLSEISYDDILRDKSLSFEDLIFLFMAKMGADLKKQMQDQMAEIAEMNKALDKKSAAADKATGTQAGSPVEQIMGDGVGGMMKALLKPENIKSGLAGALDFAKVVAPIALPAIGAAVGTIAPGVGNVIGGLAGGAGGVALGVGLDLLKGVIEAGAFDGVIEGAVGLASSTAPQKAAKAEGATDKSTGASTTKDTDSIERDRDFALEKLKLLQQRLTEMQQALSNILNAQHQTAMNAIGNIR